MAQHTLHYIIHREPCMARKLYSMKGFGYTILKLPKKVRECTSIPTFKKGLRNYVLDT